ncbi:MAG: HAD hydrolase-like protein [Gammaproteobacteria bacterium]|nr:HAD hydrolase-like protein [Gammaproteobacteria bacterium]
MLALNHFDAIAFGCNGTLIDRSSVVLKQCRRALGDRQRRLSDAEVLTAFNRARTDVQSERPMLPYGEVLARSFTGTLRQFGVRATTAATQAFAESAPQWQPFDECREALDHLARYFRLGLVCNTDIHTCQSFQAKLQAPFEVVVTAERVGAYKPDPRQFVAMISDFSLLGVTTDRLLFVGSSLRADIAPVNSLGLRTVHVDRHAPRGDRQGSAVPHLRVDSLRSLVQLHRESLRVKVA